VSRTHYEVLGVTPQATQAEIRSAYRRIALAHHPDRSKEPRSAEIFREATDAYHVLNDPARRATYDDTQERVQKYRAEQARPKAEPARRVQVSSSEPPKASPDVQRLTSLFARGRLAEAEILAREIRKMDPRQPIPYAVLGDIARSQGNLNEAQKMYAYAAQFDPTNPIYQRRYEQLLEASVVVTGRGSSTSLRGHGELVAAPAVGLGLVVAAAAVVAMSGEQSAFAALPLISSWTASVLFMLFFGGVSVGCSLSIGNYLDRFASMTTNAVGNVGPTVMLGAIALVNFWGAVLLYMALGVFQRAANFSTTRMLLGVSTVVLLLTIAGSVSPVIRPSQVFLWGGNVAYLGALVGWMVTDAFRGE
jgi:tetratricopeptide (TPR) repeat protein